MVPVLSAISQEALQHCALFLLWLVLAIALTEASQYVMVCVKRLVVHRFVQVVLPILAQPASILHARRAAVAGQSAFSEQLDELVFAVALDATRVADDDAGAGVGRSTAEACKKVLTAKQRGVFKVGAFGWLVGHAFARVLFASDKTG